MTFAACPQSTSIAVHEVDGSEGQRAYPVGDSNLLDRSEDSCFLVEIQRAASELARYCDLLYSNDSCVQFGLERMPSKRGVQQGDPSRTLLFAPWSRGSHLRGSNAR